MIEVPLESKVIRISSATLPFYYVLSSFPSSALSLQPNVYSAIVPNAFFLPPRVHPHLSPFSAGL